MKALKNDRLKAIEDTNGYFYRCAALYPEKEPHEKVYVNLVLQKTDETYAQ